MAFDLRRRNEKTIWGGEEIRGIKWGGPRRGHDTGCMRKGKGIKVGDWEQKLEKKESQRK